MTNSAPSHARLHALPHAGHELLINDVPLSRLLRLSLFQVSVGMAVVLLIFHIPLTTLTGLPINAATAALSAAMSSSDGVQFGGYPMVSGSVSAAV